MNRVDEILEHAGVKGMKWGVRKDRNTKKKTNIETFLTKSSKKKKLNPEGLILPAPVAIPVGLGMVINHQRVKRKIAKQLNGKVKDFKKADLDRAARAVRAYSNVALTTDGKNVTTVK